MAILYHKEEKVKVKCIKMTIFIQMAIAEGYIEGYIGGLFSRANHGRI